MARSELLMVRRFWYFELPNSSKLAAPVPCGGGEQALIKKSRADTEDVVTTGTGDTVFTAVHKSGPSRMPKNKQANILLLQELSRVHGNCCHDNLSPCLS